MLGEHPYFMVMASLPVLRRFDLVRHLAISRERLDSRLAILAPGDARWVELLQELLGQVATLDAADERLLKSHDIASSRDSPTALAAIAGHLLEVATILAAMRRRQAALPPSEPGECRGPQVLVDRIAGSWSSTDFGLGATHGWIREALVLLQERRFAQLEALLGRLLWKCLDRVGQDHEFDLDALLVYLCRWHVTDRWMRRSPELAVRQFRDMIDRTLNTNAAALPDVLR